MTAGTGWRAWLSKLEAGPACSSRRLGFSYTTASAMGESSKLCERIEQLERENAELREQLAEAQHSRNLTELLGWRFRRWRRSIVPPTNQETGDE